MALNPLAMDMMLPALPNIGSAFHIVLANRPQEILSTFLIGFGVGQFVMGPMSDRFGRRPVLLGGMTVYFVASILAISAPSFETLLLARTLQGLGTSATRVIATSIVRDCYAGRRMASVMSLAMMVFIAVPVVAPSFEWVAVAPEDEAVCCTRNCASSASSAQNSEQKCSPFAVRQSST